MSILDDNIFNTPLNPEIIRNDLGFQDQYSRYYNVWWKREIQSDGIFISSDLQLFNDEFHIYISCTYGPICLREHSIIHTKEEFLLFKNFVLEKFKIKLDEYFGRK